MQSEDILELNLEGGNTEAYASHKFQNHRRGLGVGIDDRRSRAGDGCFGTGSVRGATDLTDGFRRLAMDRKLEVIQVPTL